MRRRVKKSTINKFRTVARLNSGNVHIIPTSHGWYIKKEGAIRATAIFDTKDEAIEYIKSKSLNKDKIVLHLKDGRIEKYAV